MKERGERTIDVYRERFDGRRRRLFESAHEGHSRAGNPLGLRHVEERVGARIRGVYPVPEPRQPTLVADRALHHRLCRGGHRDPFARGQREAFGDELHAIRARAAMLVANSQHARSNSGGDRLPVAGGGQPGGCAGWGARAVIRYADEDGVEQAPLARRRQPAEVEQDDHVRERGVAHQRRNCVSTNPDIRCVRGCDRSAPRLHEHPIIPSVVRNGGCYGADTVTSDLFLKT